MSTQDIPDNELDNFFKKSLEEPHIAFDEEAWAKMEQKMEKAAIQQAFFRRLFYSLLLLLGLFTGIISWYLLDKKTSAAITSRHTAGQAEEYMRDKKVNTQRVAPKKEVSWPAVEKKSHSDLKDSTGITGRNNTNNQLPELPEVNEPMAKKQPHRNKSKASIQNKYPEKNIALKNKFAGKTEKKAVPEFHKGDSLLGVEKKTKYPKATGPLKEKGFSGPAKNNTSDNISSFPFSEKQRTVSSTEESKEKPGTNYFLIEPLSSLSIVLQEGYYLSDKSLAASKIITGKVPKDTSIHEKVAKPRFKPGFGVGIIVSPDMSSVGFSNWTMPGTNAGVVIEYFISGKWSLSTGAIYSTKIYKAEGKEYTPPKGFWGAYKIWPVEVDADCKILDIPLNVRYTIVAKEKFTLFASTGLSSYLMLKEDYHYNYGYYVDDKYLRKSYSTENEFKHFFSVVNFSTGYERRFNSRLSLQAEPYLKLPLAGVGFGKIKLLSTGVFFSIKYKL